MKKLLLSGLIAFMSIFAFGQATTKIGTTTNYVEIKNKLQIDGMSNSVGDDSILVVSHIDHKVYNKLFTGGGIPYTLPNASPTVLGGVKVGGNLSIDGGGVLNSSNSTITLSGDATGSGTVSIPVTIAAAAVINSKLANMTAGTIKGRNTGTGSPQDLTGTQVKSIIGLDQVNNTSDASKPISTAVNTALALKANLTSPALGGIPTAPTAAPGTNTNQIATVAFVIANSGGGSGYTLPIASFSTLGGVKVGAGLAIDGSGVLSASTAGVTSIFNRTGAITAQTGDYNFNQLSNTPTTLAGYNITDAYPLSGNPSNFLTSVPAQSWASLTGKPTTAAGLNLTDPFVYQTDVYTNPSFVNTLAWSKITGRPTTISGYNITDAVSLAGTQTLTNKTITSPLGIVKADVGLGNVDNTSDAIKNAATATFTNKTISGVTNSITNVSEASITNLVTDLGNKAPSNNATFTGTTTLPLTTNAVLLTDIHPLFTFGAGSGITGDTLSFSTSTTYGSVFNSGAYSYVITAMSIVVQGGSPNITVDVLFGSTFNSGGTHLVNAGTPVTGTTLVTVFDNATIAPGNFIQVKTPVVPVGSKPTYLQITLIGYKIRN